MTHLEAFLKAMKADAALVHSPENMRWLAGYTGEGCLFIGKDARVVLTDFRYIEQVRRQAPDWTLVQVSGERNYPALIREQVLACGAKTIHAETGFLTYDAYRALETALASSVSQLGEAMLDRCTALKTALDTMCASWEV